MLKQEKNVVVLARMTNAATLLADRKPLQSALRNRKQKRRQAQNELIGR